jgi:tripartite-type tricarboxylate transporter receptor subunit TctC
LLGEREMPSSLPFIQSRQLHALAVTSRERAGAAPDIPTLRESGLPDYEATTWFGVLAPPKLNPELTQRLYGALRDGMGSAESRQAMSARGIEPVLDTPADFRAELEADIERWRAVTRGAKITLE